MIKNIHITPGEDDNKNLCIVPKNNEIEEGDESNNICSDFFTNDTMNRIRI